MCEELKREENKNRIARWEELRVEAIKADLEHSNGLRHVGRHKNLAWKWVKSKETVQEELEEEHKSKDQDILMLEPNFYGLGFRLKPLISWFGNLIK